MLNKALLTLRAFRVEFGNLLLQVVGVGLAVPISIVVTRHLGAEGRGEFALVTMTSALVALVAGGGWADAVPSIMRRNGVGRGLTPVHRAFAVSSIPIALLWGVAAPSFLALLQVDVGPAMGGLAGVLVLLGAIWVFHLQAGAARGRWRLPSLADAVRVGLYGAAIVGFYVVGRLTPETAVFSFAFAYAAGLGLTRGDRTRLPSGPQLTPADRSLARKSIFGSLLQYAATRADVLLVAALLDVRNAGLYAAAAGFADLLVIIANAAAGPVLSRIVQCGGIAGSTWTFVKSRVALTLALSGAAALLLIAAAPAVVTIAFGSDFKDAVLPLRLLAVGAVFAGGVRVLRTANIALGRVMENWRADGFCVAVVVTGNLMLTSAFGLSAAASVTTLATAVEFSYLTLRLRTLAQQSAEAV